MKVLSEVQSAPSRAIRHKALFGLVGLGPGSTPSGADFIVGVLLGEEALRVLRSKGAKEVADRRNAVVPWAKEKEGLWVAMDRTNDAGKTLLWQALQGRFPNYLIETLRSVADARGTQEVGDAVERAVSCGATSGTDALTGFLFSMEGMVARFQSGADDPTTFEEETRHFLRHEMTDKAKDQVAKVQNGFL